MAPSGVKPPVFQSTIIPESANVGFSLGTTGMRILKFPRDEQSSKPKGYSVTVLVILGCQTTDVQELLSHWTVLKDEVRNIHLFWAIFCRFFKPQSTSIAGNIIMYFFC